jgi:hypothetical protein
VLTGHPTTRSLPEEEGGRKEFGWRAKNVYSRGVGGGHVQCPPPIPRRALYLKKRVGGKSLVGGPKMYTRGVWVGDMCSAHRQSHDALSP